MKQENLRIKTITIELLEGIPKGLRRAEFTTQLMRVLVVPRNKETLLAKCPERDFQAVYLLVGEDKSGAPIVYIGKTSRMILRAKEHTKGKFYWNNILYFITKDDSLTSTELEYLEWLLIAKASDAGNFIIDNANRGCKEEPKIEPAQKSDFTDYYNQIVALTEVLGYGDIFTQIHTDHASEKDLFYCKSTRGIEGTLAVREDGYYVLKGSRCSTTLTKSGKKNQSISKKR